MVACKRGLGSGPLSFCLRVAPLDPPRGSSFCTDPCFSTILQSLHQSFWWRLFAAVQCPRQRLFLLPQSAIVLLERNNSIENQASKELNIFMFPATA